MYFYIYDTKLSDQQYKKRVHLMENRISERGLSGRKLFIDPDRDTIQCAQEIKELSVRTIVFVGSESLFRKGLSFFMEKRLSDSVCFAYIPDEENVLSRTLGIKPLEESVPEISRRKLQSVRVFEAGKIPFIVSLEIGGIDFSDHSFWKKIDFFSKLTPLSIRVRVNDEYTITSPFENLLIFNITFPGLFENLSKVKQPIDLIQDNERINLLYIPKLKGINTIALKDHLSSREYFDIKNISILLAKKVQFQTVRRISGFLDGAKIDSIGKEIRATEHVIRFLVGKDRSFGR